MIYNYFPSITIVRGSLSQKGQMLDKPAATSYASRLAIRSNNVFFIFCFDYGNIILAKYLKQPQNFMHMWSIVVLGRNHVYVHVVLIMEISKIGVNCFAHIQ